MSVQNTYLVHESSIGLKLLRQETIRAGASDNFTQAVTNRTVNELELQ